MRALVTGASGFVGQYLTSALGEAGYDVHSAGGPHDDGMPAIDLADVATMHAALELARPDVVFHLAAQTFVPDAIASPLATYDTNVLGTARLLDALRAYRNRTGVNPRLLFTSSAEVYGAQEPEAFPLTESLASHPANPYAASKAAAEAVVLAEVRSYGIDAVVTRAFNHIGPGQSERFVVPAFAKQLARIAAGGDPKLFVGNLNAQRDFLDVRDVVAAYVALASDGTAGAIYNVCSGTPVSIQSVLRELIFIARVPVEVREDPERMRPSDVPVFYGNNAALRAATNWSPRIPLRQSLRDIFQSL
ncbi:MAG TPA: GDP-mannose 4,6-dehydratase [Candidatus Baltobacteraceae bacterium]